MTLLAAAFLALSLQRYKNYQSIKKNRKTYEIVTGGSLSNSGDPGEGRSAIFVFLGLVGVSRSSLEKKKQKISAED